MYAFVSGQSVNEAIRKAVRLLLATYGNTDETFAEFDAAHGRYRISTTRIADEVRREAAAQHAKEAQ